MHPAVGQHYILELYNCEPNGLNDEQFVRQAVIDAAVRAGATLLQVNSHCFSPCGVTALGLLAESHLSIHTWPETGYVAIDLFTCGHTATPQKACTFLTDYFKAVRHNTIIVPRGHSEGPKPQPSQD